ncbi:MAG: hypothetical protein RIB60_03490 [Phycisphaerales bacterium]
MVRIILLIACLAGSAIGASNEPPVAFTAPTPVEDRNAAIAYQRAWLMAPEGVLDQVPTPETLEASLEGIGGGDSLIQMLLAATRIDGCDFQTPFEQGTDAPLPHLTLIRRTGQLLIADAQSLFEFGDYAGIAERLAAVIRLADHTTNDRVFVSSMTAGRLLADVEPVVVELAATGELGADSRAVLLDALARFERDDPYRISDAIARVVEVSIANSIPALLAGDREDAATHAGTLDTFGSGEREPRVSDERREALMAEVRPWVTDAIAAWNAENALNELRALHQAAQQGRYGTLGQKGLYSIVRARSEQDRWDAALESMRAALADDSE